VCNKLLDRPFSPFSLTETLFAFLSKGYSLFPQSGPCTPNFPPFRTPILSTQRFPIPYDFEYGHPQLGFLLPPFLYKRNVAFVFPCFSLSVNVTILRLFGLSTFWRCIKTVRFKLWAGFSSFVPFPPHFSIHPFFFRGNVLPTPLQRLVPYPPPPTPRSFFFQFLTYPPPSLFHFVFPSPEGHLSYIPPKIFNFSRLRTTTPPPLSTSLFLPLFLLFPLSEHVFFFRSPPKG